MINQENILAALKRFKAANGRTWKSKLKDCWFTGYYTGFKSKAKVIEDDIKYLQQARNLDYNLKEV